MWQTLRRRRAACRAQHPACNTVKGSGQPRRLLEIVQDGLRLLDCSEASQLTSRYVALSYCWGTSASICSTTDTIASLYQGIPTHSLPAVITDAITVATNMGERFLWIDRLCIQQDDSEDWALHSQTMDQIYEHAEFVIAAVTSATVEEPFLGEVSALGRRSLMSFGIGSTNSAINHAVKSPQPCLRLRSRNALEKTEWHRKRKDIKAENPLDARGWAFQERYLASRCVRFEFGQVVWECSAVIRGEGVEAVSTVEGLVSIKAKASGEFSIERWNQLVVQYTKRRLTYGTDKLPGISGIAAWFAVVMDCDYVAGLWATDLTKQLSWYVTDSSSSGDLPCTLSGSPSWSWASLDRHIMFDSMKRWRMWRSANFATVIDIRCIPLSGNIFGPVDDTSFIELETLTINVEMSLPIAHHSSPHRLGDDNLSRQGLPRARKRALILDGALELVQQESEINGVHSSQDRIMCWQRARPAWISSEQPRAWATVKLLLLRLDKLSMSGIVTSPSQSQIGAWCRIGFFGLTFEEKDCTNYCNNLRKEAVKIV